MKRAQVVDHAATVPHPVTGVPWSRVLARRIRAGSLAVERRVAWAVRPTDFGLPTLAGPVANFPHVLFERRVPLHRTDGHPILEAGKRVNVALTAPLLDGLSLLPGRTFSFWRTIGRIRESDGYRHGMELRGGCVVPALGGGLCLLSNTLFNAAVRLGWRVIERHGHTMEAVPPSPGEPWGLDATVAYPYIDLRFAVPVGDSPARLGVIVHGESLLVQVRAAQPSTRTVRIAVEDDEVHEVAGQPVRRNRLVRHVVEADGTIGSQVVAVNAKRLLHDHQFSRNCLTCGLTSCAGRVEVPLGESRTHST